jgi:hypothetical protein
MAYQEAAIANVLNGIIDSLEEARSSALGIGESDDVYIEKNEIDSDVADYMDGPDSALVVLESRITYLVDVISEEIDNLRSLMETLKGLKKGASYERTLEG